MATIIHVTKSGRKTPIFTLAKGDARTKRVQFVIPRDDAEVPLDELTWRIVIKNAVGEQDGTALPKEVHGDHIDLWWTCGYIVANAVGLTTIYLNAFNEDGKMQWSSGEYCIHVIPAKEDEQEEGKGLSELQELIESARQAMDNATQETMAATQSAIEAAGSANEAANTAEKAAENAEAAAGGANDSAIRADEAAESADKAKEDANTAAEKAQQAANTANTAANNANQAANAANTAAEAADNARLAISDELNKKAPAIFVDASGDMVHITDGAAMPVQSLVTHIEPVQSGSGDPSPDNVRPISGWDGVSARRAGKNLLPYLDLPGERNGITFASNNDGTYVVDGTATADAYYRSSTAPIALGVLPAGKYTVSISPVEAAQKVRGRVTNKTGNTSVGTTSRETGAATFTADGVSEYGFGFYVAKDATVEQLTVSIQIEHGESATAHEQYQGQTLTAELPETVYGGTLNWTTGLMTVTHALQTFDGSEVWTAYDTNIAEKKRYISNLKNPGKAIEGSNIPVAVCNVYQIRSNDDVYKRNQGVAISSSGSKMIVFDDAHQTGDVSSFRAHLAELAAAGTPMTLVYPIATPYTIQLTPQQMETLKGTNNIWSNAGATEVTYAADTKMYADGKDSTAMIGTAEPGMIATKNYASGAFIVVGKNLYIATAAIATGEAITPGTNCTATTVIEQLASIYNLLNA